MAPPEHQETARRIRAVVKTRSKTVAILQDLPGPKIRQGFQTDWMPRNVSPVPRSDIVGDQQRVSVDYPQHAMTIQAQTLLLTDSTVDHAIEEAPRLFIACRPRW